MATLSYMDLNVTTAQLASDAFLVNASGELDLWSSKVFDDELSRVVALGARHVIVDLTSVPLIDSVVLGVLMRHAKRLKADAGEVVLISDDPRTLRVIDITGLAYLFRMERSLAEAVEHVTRRRVA